MLKNIDPALNADVLHALRSMGHGDTLVISDTNFPSDAIARQTTLGKLLHIDNVSSARAVRAILSVLPLDTPLQPSAGRMEVMGASDEVPAVQREVQAEIDAPREAGSDVRHRALCLLRGSKEGLLRHHHRRDAILRLLSFHQGRHSPESA